MRRLRQLDLALITAVLAVAGAAALSSQSGKDSAYPTIGADLEPLRAAFNAEPDNVRAVLLASPT